MSNSVHRTYYEFLHKKFEYTCSLFLDDIIDETASYPIGEYFDIQEIGDMLRIIPLFYCSEIRTDGDSVIVDSPYMIMVPNDYKNIINFVGKDKQKSPIIVTTNFDENNNNRFITTWTQTQDTGELTPNIQYKVIFKDGNDDVIKEEYRMTGYHGYDGFIKPDEAESIELEVVE